MRLKAPEGRGNPVLRGVELKPASDGCFNVDDGRDIETMRALGYFDPAEEAPSRTLRGAVAAALHRLGVTVPGDAGDDALIKALGNLPGMVDERALASVKRAEKDVEDRLKDSSKKK